MEEEKKVESVIKEVESIPVVDVSLIVSVISLILSFVAGIIWFIVGYSTLYNIVSLVISLNPDTATVVNSIAASITGMGALYLIIVWPIAAFIGTFILTAIVVLLYNLLAPKVGYIKLQLK
jgi:hypothetical protein